MASLSILQITITIKNPNLEDDEKLEYVTKNLYLQLRRLEEVEKVERIPDPNPPQGNMGGGYLPGMLKAETEASNIETVLEIARKNLSRKFSATIKCPNGIQVTLDGNCSQQEFSALVQETIQKCLALGA